MTDKEKRALEFEALAIEAQSICVEVQGMRFYNETCLQHKQSLNYSGGAFYQKARELNEIAEKIRGLNND